MVSTSVMTRASVTAQMNIVWVSRSTVCSTFRDMKLLMYMPRKDTPLSERRMPSPTILLTSLPLWKPKCSNTLNGASVDRQLTFMTPVFKTISWVRFFLLMQTAMRLGVLVT